jgi:transketolase
MIFNGPTKTGHIAPGFSIAELINYLLDFCIYKKNKKINYLILSKGHAAPILYSKYYLMKLISKNDFNKFRTFNSKLQGHPDKRFLKLLDSGSGALGQGLSIAAGYACAARMTKSKKNAFCILGDGELQEGQIWEAAMFAGVKKLDNLCAIIDGNKFQNEYSVKETMDLTNIKKKWQSFGWNYLEINGHSFEEINRAINYFKSCKRPLVIYANTIKGKGVSFMENKVEWHHQAPTQKQFNLALEEYN